MRITSAGLVGIGDTANANMTQGLTINQGAADNEILAFKSSDVAHGLVSTAETDTFAHFKKLNANYGGLFIRAIAEDAAVKSLQFQAVGGTATTGKTTASRALVEYNIYEHDGSDGYANVTANGNIYAVRAQVGGSALSRVLIDEDGDIYSVTSAQTFDDYDDAQLVRAFSTASGDVVKSKWDDFVNYNEQALIDADVLGAPVKEGGMTNVTQLQRLHNGAIWQQYTEMQKMKELMYDTMVELIGKDKADAKLKDHDIKLLDKNTSLN
tara:strand:- start:262 stop:1065 length:804 start_codon:yes stop_codon:yes gene_type:complete